MAKNTTFNIGDKVGIINDTLSGIITHIESTKITIQCDEGFDYQCNPSEIIKQGFYDKDLTRNNIPNAYVEKHKSKTPRQKSDFKSNKKSPLLEVDLHIHQLVKSEKGMTNYDMLSLQLKTAKTKLEYAISKKIQKVVFIHGIGEGVLRSELHLMLKNYSVDIFDASYSKYGQGATEIYIYQN